jgi:hypothetical protein
MVAADAAVGQLHHVLLDGDQELTVDIDVAKFIHQHRNAKGIEVLQECGSAGWFCRCRESP